jgi:uncharacterized damage-inducible protein DinB
VSAGTEIWRDALWEQFGASLAMLERAIDACPESLWTSNAGSREFWHLAYHTLFFTDLNFSGTTHGFSPPPPFSLAELDPSDIRPERVYTKAELIEYVRHCREKGRVVLGSLTDLEAVRSIELPWIHLKFGEFMLYSMRHVQHHTGQLNVVLRQAGIDAPDWIPRASGNWR